MLRSGVNARCKEDNFMKIADVKTFVVEKIHPPISVDVTGYS
jgi:hypothetical protein